MSRWVQTSNGVQPTPFEKYGAGGPVEHLTVMPPSPTSESSVKPWHPDSPLFWVGVLGAVTFGLAGVATSFRVGPAKAAVTLGNP